MPRKPEEWSNEYNHITKVFGPRLLELMEGMTITELAVRSGVSTGTISNWISGRTVPDIVRLFAISNVLGASIDWMVGLDDDGAPKRGNAYTQ